MNKVILTGNLCKDIEKKQTNTGMSVVTNSVAVSRDFKDKEGNYPTDFINIVVWDKAADYLENYAHKGDRVELCGRIQNRTYKAKDGGNRQVTEIQVENIKVFSKDKQQSQTEPKEESSFDDVADLPF